MITLPFLVLALLMWWVLHDLPKLDSIEDYKPYLINEVYDREDRLVAEFILQRRTVVPVWQVPEHVKNAFIAAEDADFYNHNGVDYWGIIRAVIAEFNYRLVGGKRVGGSTITQQTAKTMLLTRSRTYSRKIKELVLAKRMEDKLTKDEILNIYLNQIYFGHGVYGIEEAAKYYYGIKAEQLSLGQAAALASIPKSPNRINPVSNPERTQTRRAYVLNSMSEKGFISHATAQRALSEKITSNHVLPKKPYLNAAPYFTEALRKQLVKEMGSEGLYRGGLKIYATLDLTVQKSAIRSLRRGLRLMDTRQGYHGPQIRFQSDVLEQVADDLALAKTLIPPDVRAENKVWNLRNLTKNTFINAPETINEYVQYVPLEKGAKLSAPVLHVSDKNQRAKIDLGTTEGFVNFESIKWARDFSTDESYPSPKKISQVIHKGDVIPLKVLSLEPLILTLEQPPRVQGALVAIEPQSHEVLALVGGYDFNESKFNRAIQAKRQPGSAFKPLLYSQALEREIMSPASLITDAPRVFYDGSGKNQWKPKNDTGKFLGDITLRTCLRKSINTCSVSILEKVGIKPMHEFGKKLGLNTESNPFPHDLTLSLGSADMTPLNLVNAYTIFPNHGKYAPPILVKKITNLQDEIIFEAVPEESQAIRPETAYLMVNLMEDVIDRGTARRAKRLPYELAGKTGSTNDLRSTWFIGYSPNLVAGVYLGLDNNQPLGRREYATTNALPIWIEFMERTLRNRPKAAFEEPEGLEWHLIDESSGLLSRKSLLQQYTANKSGEDKSSMTTPDGTFLEAFIPGTAPTEYAEDHRDSIHDLFGSGGL